MPLASRTGIRKDVHINTHGDLHGYTVTLLICTGVIRRYMHRGMIYTRHLKSHLVVVGKGLLSNCDAQESIVDFGLCRCNTRVPRLRSSRFSCRRRLSE